MRILKALIAVFLVGMAACSSSESSDPGTPGASLVIGGIPDQDFSRLEERFGGIADYLANELGIKVDYRPVTLYPTLVTAFQNGDVQLAWFGGLSGVQARLATPGAKAVLQRPGDAEFTSVFIVRSDVDANGLSDLRGKSFTFGSESSTSGHLMPRHFLVAAGIDPESDFLGPPSYSGSHDKTWKLVEAGTFDAGALNAVVWQRAVDEREVDFSKVRVLLTTEPYYDYHWVEHPGIDARLGSGTAEKIEQALLNLSSTDPDQSRILELFDTDRFIATQNSNYDAIEEVARDLDLVR